MPQTPSGDEVTALSTREGSVLGTVPYMAPEQAAGMPVDARADLFSFSVILFQLVTGKLPFRGETTMALLRAVLNDRPERLNAAAVGCPARYAALVGRLMAKEPGDRPASVADVQRELEEIARDSELQRTSVSRVAVLSADLTEAVRAGRKSPPRFSEYALPKPAVTKDRVEALLLKSAPSRGTNAPNAMDEAVWTDAA